MTVQRILKRPKIGEDLPRSGQHSTSSNEKNINKVKAVVMVNRHASLR